MTSDIGHIRGHRPEILLKFKAIISAVSLDQPNTADRQRFSEDPMPDG